MMKLCADPEGPRPVQRPGLRAQAGGTNIFHASIPGTYVVVAPIPVRDEALKKIIVLKLGKIAASSGES